MQIIEVSVIGVRSGVLRLTRRSTPLRFEIFPMVHIGEPAFYAAVAERLRRCDLIVAEGVGPSAAASVLTSSYRLPTWFQRSGLVEQNIRYESLGVPVLRPDMTAEQFAAGWRQVPLWQRAMATVMAPLAGLDHLVFGSRRALAREMEVTDVEWYDEMVDVESIDDLMGLLGEQRDRLLIAALDEIHRERQHEAITVAVVYGADHVAPVVHGLRAVHGYGVRGAEWLTVFGF